jgi:hypothetical protein
MVCFSFVLVWSCGSWKGWCDVKVRRIGDPVWIGLPSGHRTVATGEEIEVTADERAALAGTRGWELVEEEIEVAEKPVKARRTKAEQKDEEQS